MIKHLTQHGNSSALIIEKPILELLGITNKTPLEIVTDGKNLIISPVTKGSHQRKFDKALDNVIKSHHKTFQTLSK